MFPVLWDANEDGPESAGSQLAACHHCGARSIEETKGSVSVNSSSPRQTDTVAASWKQAAQTGLMAARSHAPPLPHPINQAFICFLHQLPVICSLDVTPHTSDKPEEKVSSWISKTIKTIPTSVSWKLSPLFVTVMLGKFQWRLYLNLVSLKSRYGSSLSKTGGVWMLSDKPCDGWWLWSDDTCTHGQTHLMFEINWRFMVSSGHFCP